MHSLPSAVSKQPSFSWALKRIKSNNGCAEEVVLPTQYAVACMYVVDFEITQKNIVNIV